MKKAVFFITVCKNGKIKQEEKQGWRETLSKAGSEQTIMVCYDKRGETWTATEESTGMAILSGAPTKTAAHEKAVAMFDRIISALPGSRAWLAANIDE